MRKIQTALLLSLVAVPAMAGTNDTAFAETMTGDAATVFAAVKLVLVGVVSFLILLKIVKKVRSA